eukprot:31609_1
MSSQKHTKQSSYTKYHAQTQKQKLFDVFGLKNTKIFISDEKKNKSQNVSFKLFNPSVTSATAKEFTAEYKNRYRPWKDEFKQFINTYSIVSNELQIKTSYKQPYPPTEVPQAKVSKSPKKSKKKGWKKMNLGAIHKKGQ